MSSRGDASANQRPLAEALAETLAAYDGGQPSMTRALWSEALGEALAAPPCPRTFEDLLETLEARPRAGQLFRDLVLLVREQAQLDPQRLLQSFPNQSVH